MARLGLLIDLRTERCDLATDAMVRLLLLIHFAACRDINHADPVINPARSGRFFFGLCRISRVRRHMQAGAAAVCKQRELDL